MLSWLLGVKWNWRWRVLELKRLKNVKTTYWEGYLYGCWSHQLGGNDCASLRKARSLVKGLTRTGRWLVWTSKEESDCWVWRERGLPTTGRRRRLTCLSQRLRERRNSLSWKVRNMEPSGRRRKKQGQDEKWGEFAHNRTDFDWEELFFIRASKKNHSPSPGGKSESGKGIERKWKGGSRGGSWESL